jgi:LysR family transcriptional regulator for metE and metH
MNNYNNYPYYYEYISYMIGLTHLKIVAALTRHGTLTAPAYALFLSQSALTHQIRYLEKKLGVERWERQR